MRGKISPKGEGWGEGMEMKLYHHVPLYQVFDPATKPGKIDAKGAADGHTGHTQQKGKDFVFSSWRP